MEAPIPFDEPARLAALYASRLLDAGANQNFDRVTRLAASLFDVPISLVSLVDADRQWFGSRWGLEALETPRCDAFCAHAILDSTVFIVENAADDDRFSDNPLVTGPPDIRFYAGAPISSPDGHRLGTLCIIDSRPRTLDAEQAAALRDLADLIERELYVIGMALTDPLTGLGNRRALFQAGTGLLELAVRNDQPMSILYADVDGLKLVNDELGHCDGDELISRAGTVLRNTMRSSDVIARIGGDEFAGLMYGTDAPEAEVLHGRILAAIADHNASDPERPPMSLSIGTAVAEPGESIEQLVKRADALMYAAKRSAQSTARGGLG